MLVILNWNYLISILISVLAALIAIIIHEVAHGYTAYLMGDKTAKTDGRLSLNPLKHIDWIGAVCLVLFHFGWAKPVPVNPYFFKNRRLGIVLVSLAGPLSNFILAILAIIGLCICDIFVLNVLFFQFFYTLSAVSLGLGIFNLIPIPPLDGSKIFAQLLPINARIKYLNFERYGWIILFLLIYFGNFTTYLGIARDHILIWLFNLIAGVIL